MSQPIPYTRQFGFTDYAASFPAAPLPGVAIDAELNAALDTFGGILGNIAKIQRDDGALRNQIVTLDALSPSVIYALGAGVIWLPRGAWTPATAYAVSDVIQNGTASYVCAIPHVSLATFTQDLAGGAWVNLFDEAGATPSDGSVTPAKLAPGAVTSAAIGFTGLDLLGAIRAAGGLQAGTAPLGSMLHVKTATGDVLAKVERATDDQGMAGYQIIGMGVTWSLTMAANSNDLMLGNTTFRAAAGGLDQAGALRATTGSVPAAGAGAALHYAGATGFITSFDYDASAWRPLKLRGSDVYLTAGGIDVAHATATGVDFTAASIGGASAGYLDVPQNAQAGAYTLTLADRGRHIYSANTGAQTIAIPLNAAVAFPIGSVIAIFNDGTGAITIAQGGTVLKQAGTPATGDRMLAVNGLATLLKIGADRWVLSGVGIS